MTWKSLLAAVLLLPSLAYVAGLMYATDPAPARRPVVVLPAGAGSDATSARPRPTRTPSAGTPQVRPGPDDPDDPDDDADDRDDSDDREDDDDIDDIDVVRPDPRDSDDGDDGGDDRDDAGDD